MPGREQAAPYTIMASKKKHEYDESLFADTTMTFGEHLEELRSALLRSLIAVTIGFALGLLIANQTVSLIRAPLEAALKRYVIRKAILQYEQFVEEQTKLGLPVPYSAEQFAPLAAEHGLTFQHIFVHPTDVLRQLHEAYPDTHGAELALPGNPPGHPLSPLGPLEVIAADLQQPHLIVERLMDAGSGGQPGPLLHFWGLLSGSQRTTLKGLFGNPGLSNEQRDELVKILNALIASGDLYAPEAFVGMNLPPEAKAFAARSDKLEPIERQRFHRVLLEAVFPAELSPSHPELISLFIWRKIEDDERTRATSLGAQEAFMLWLKAGLITGLVVASPFVFYYLWMFVAAGLYPHERHYVYLFGPISLGLFLSGAAIAFFFVFTPVLDFLFQFNESLGIEPDLRISEWLSFVLILPLGFGISFQLPLAMFFLERIRLFSVDTYLSQWRMAVMVIVLLSAILTPADPYSIFFMAVPLSLLYFAGVFACKLAGPPGSPEEALETA